MTESDASIVKGLVTEEIRRLVADVIERGGFIQTGPQATSVVRAYANCGMSADQIAEEILRAAVQARIAVEMSRPDQAHLAEAC